MAAACAFIRGNAVYLLCRLMARKELSLLMLPGEAVAVLMLVFALSAANCCLVMVMSVETGSAKGRVMCISIAVSITLTYYFMLNMVERLNYLVKKQRDDELYMEEMRYKETYYAEAEKRNEYVRKLKHDLKNRILGFHHLAVSGDTGALSRQIESLCSEIGQIDSDTYTENPAVDSVLRVKFGTAKAEGIRVDTQVRIPRRLGMEHGDIGVLYGNLLDNAIEACRKVAPGERFIRLENKYLSGALVLVVTNSKEGRENRGLVTTKKDRYGHGHGIASVRRVVEKYGGTVRFTDSGAIFEASLMLYGVRMDGENAKRYI